MELAAGMAGATGPGAVWAVSAEAGTAAVTASRPVVVVAAAVVGVGRNRAERAGVGLAGLAGLVLVAKREVVVRTDSGRWFRLPREVPRGQYSPSAQKDWYRRRMCKSSCLRM